MPLTGIKSKGGEVDEVVSYLLLMKDAKSSVKMCNAHKGQIIPFPKYSLEFLIPKRAVRI